MLNMRYLKSVRTQTIIPANICNVQDVYLTNESIIKNGKQLVNIGNRARRKPTTTQDRTQNIKTIGSTHPSNNKKKQVLVFYVVHPRFVGNSCCSIVSFHCKKYLVNQCLNFVVFILAIVLHVLFVVMDYPLARDNHRSSIKYLSQRPVTTTDLLLNTSHKGRELNSKTNYYDN